MKKNKMMRAAGALMVVTLLTLSIVSGTFAKYVTSSSASDSARVAKFGVTVTADGSLFDNNYFAADENTPAGTTPDGEKNGTADAILTVESTNGKVVAPGTKNTTGLSVAVTGQPEVDVQVGLAVTATDIFLNDYYPIKYTLTRNGANVKTGTLAEVEAALEGFAGRYDANTNLSTSIGTFVLTWEWDFDANGAGTNDSKDTLLGDIAAGVETTLPSNAYSTNTSVAIEVSVTQID